ncbi:MAG: adenylate kinase [Acholeplasmataceae bacterium]|nr:adenylate kinase [Acholeplasmataceae bacterium]
MIFLISGETHTGKTLLSQRLLETHHIPYLSIDHLKMGLIRSGLLPISPEDSWDVLTNALWPILIGIIKTAIENKQHLIIEGCYIPFDYRKDFTPVYLDHIRMLCLIHSKSYIESHFDLIKRHAHAIEDRLKDEVLDQNDLIRGNLINKAQAEHHGVPYMLIDQKFSLEELLNHDMFSI